MESQNFKGSTAFNNTKIICQSETHHLLRIFPEELWNVILSNVSNAKDYYKLAQVCIFFQNVLCTLRKTALFGDVWKILLEREAHSYTFNDTIWTPTFTRPTRTPTKFSFWISLRQVSRPWKDGIDSSLQNLDCHFLSFRHCKDMQRNLSQNNLIKHLTTNYGCAWKDIEHFDRHFHFTHGLAGTNPFVLRKICVMVPYGLQDSCLIDYHRNCLELLQKYGEHVWFLNVTSPAFGISEHVEVYNKTVEMLQYLPNLKKLEFGMQHSCTYKGTFLYATGAGNRIVPTDKLYPFPHLPNLTFVDQSELHFPLLLQIVEPNHLHLKDLGMTLQSDNDLSALLNHNFQFRITKLKLDVKQLKVPWGDVFSMLKRKFEETLIQLQIWLPASNNLNTDDRLLLKNLRILETKFVTPEPLDFLLGLADSLEELIVSVKNVDDIKSIAKQERKLKLYRNFRDPVASNIWKKLLKIQHVTCRDDIYFWSGLRVKKKK